MFIIELQQLSTHGQSYVLHPTNYNLPPPYFRAVPRHHVISSVNILVCSFNVRALKKLNKMLLLYLKMIAIS